MLVLTRRVSEAIRVEVNGVEMEILVKEIRGKQVRLGVRASKDAKVDRLDVNGEVERRKTVTD